MQKRGEPAEQYLQKGKWGWEMGCGMWDVGWDDGMFFKEKLGNFLLIVSIFLIKQESVSGNKEEIVGGLIRGKK